MSLSLPQQPSGPRSGEGDKGKTTFPALRAPHHSLMPGVRQGPRGPWLRRGNRKNGFLIGTTMAWGPDESSESAGRERELGSGRGLGPGSGLGKERQADKRREVLGFHNGGRWGVSLSFLQAPARGSEGRAKAGWLTFIPLY